MSTPLETALASGLANCARCGNDHEALEWHEFKRPVETVDGGGSYRYWATCPDTGDPIMLWVGLDDKAASANAEPVG